MAASWRVLVLVLRYHSAWSRNRGKSFPCNANSRYMKGMKLCNRTTRSSNPIFGLNSENVFASFLLSKLLGRIGITYAFCCVFGWFDILIKELLCSTRNDKNVVTFTNVPVSDHLKDVRFFPRKFPINRKKLITKANETYGRAHS